MNTLAWILILSAIILARAVMKGRVMNIGEDLSDAFLALVRGESKDLEEVFARTGDGITPASGVVGASIGSTAANAAWRIVGKYTLGNVKPHVAAAAKRYGEAYGIKTVYGYRSTGSVPNSDHPKGLALDFMVSAKSAESKERGDALASALLQDSQVTYVIWNKKIRKRGESEWRDYSGPSDHTDHVHASFVPA